MLEPFQSPQNLPPTSINTAIGTADIGTPDFPIQIEGVRSEQGGLQVLRDDLLLGGSKQRACMPYLQELAKSGCKTFVYASPFAGFAQVALAVSAHLLGLECILFCEQDQSNGSSGHLHPFSKLARSYGAKVFLTDSLASATTEAQGFVEEDYRSQQIPLGFNDPIFHKYFERAVREIWHEIETSQGKNSIQRVWVSVGSGTLSSCLRVALPAAVTLVLVDVRVLSPQDPRILQIQKLPNSLYMKTLEKFAEPCQLPPAIPSNVHYDAKVWRFLQTLARPGDLWWNVAR